MVKVQAKERALAGTVLKAELRSRESKVLVETCQSLSQKQIIWDFRKRYFCTVHDHKTCEEGNLLTEPFMHIH